MGSNQTFRFVFAVIGVLMTGLFAATGVPAQDLPKQHIGAEGAWFLCEFAHSKIPPSDDCRMLDDDGFMVRGGTVFHVKISNSRETGCRGGRAGNCMAQGDTPLRADISEIGPIEVEDARIKVRFLGCSQAYTLTPHGAYIEIRPTGDQCFWTPDKRYYVSKYKGPLILAED